jgi:hypothetical protein
MKNKQTIFQLLILLVCLVTLLGLGFVGYKYVRLRNAYFRLEEIYLTEINENVSSNILNKIRSELFEKNTIITNDLSFGYEQFPSPDQVNLNKKPLKPVNTDQPVKILTVGHIYANNQAAIPPAVLSTNMVVLMGDLVNSPAPATFSALREGLIDPLSMPVFNVPGNHDFYAGRELYQEYFGQTFFSFTHGPAQLIFLDTEIGNCSILGKQKEMLDLALEQASVTEDTKYVFIFMHKVLFQNLNLPGVGNLTTNHEYCDLFGSNFEEILNNQLIPISENKPVYVFAGDVGKSGNEFSYFTSQLEGTQVYLNTAGIGEQPADAALLITYDQAEVTLTKVPLTP